MRNYLLEIGTEELPAGYIKEACNRLEEIFTRELQNANLSFSSLSTLSTPRRLALIIENLAEKQETTSKKVKGPPVKSSFKEDGSPLPQAQGFASKHGLTVDQLEREELGKEVYLMANLTIEGKPASDVLSEIAPQAIHELSGERLMRWGDSELKFVRPIRWIVSLLDSKVVDFKLDGVRAGNETFGHRILAPGKIALNSADQYAAKLKEAKVIACPKEREEIIKKEVNELAVSVDGKARQIAGPLLDEVVNITEWPHAILGKFAEDYLSLPDVLLETVMVHHQRYFPVEKKDAKSDATTATSGNLLPYFIAIANNDIPNASEPIQHGNERVLRARLADGKFFYFDDQKTKLSARRQQLSQLTFQHGLGSYLDKTERLAKLSAKISQSLKLEPKVSVPFERTMELCKLDLVTNLVGELPELQGYVGAWYAELEGEPPEVVRAISSHYSPRSNEDSIPKDIVGRFAAVLDKMDHLTGLFALGKKPSGSSDPFALRRNAQGVIDILIDGLPGHAINLDWIQNELIDVFEPMLRGGKKTHTRDEIKTELGDFLIQRLRSKLLEAGSSREVVEAVLTSTNPLLNPHDTLIRCRCLDKLVKTADGLNTVKAGVRVGNILKPESPENLDEAKLLEPIEKELWKAFNDQVKSKWEKNGSFRNAENEQEYDEMLRLLSPISPLVDKFFDDVMVNDPDKVKRDNRHALLKNINRYYNSIANFPKLQPLLP